MDLEGRVTKHSLGDQNAVKSLNQKIEFPAACAEKEKTAFKEYAGPA
ncbi:MAG: hypothetical protein AAGH72_09295 [Verrucomicrobiota bacterium]